MAEGRSKKAAKPPKRKREVSPQPPSAEAKLRQRLAEAISEASTLVELAGALAEGDDCLDAAFTTAVLRRLPGLMASAAMPAGITEEALTARLDTGEGFEAASLPSRWPEDRNERSTLWRCRGACSTSPEVAGAAAFLRAQDCVEEVLDDSAMRTNASLEWLADVAAFYGALRPGPPLPSHILEDCADEALRRLVGKECPRPTGRSDLAHLCRLARGVAQCGALMRHGVYAAVADEVARHAEELERTALHDCALALALVRPWDAAMAQSAEALQRALPVAPALAAPDPAVANAALADGEARSGPALAGSSVPGERMGEQKENQDRFLATLADGCACLAVVDGHGKRGAVVASEVCEHLRRALPRLPGGLGAEARRQAADAVLLADSSLLLDAKVDTELSGAACAAVVVQGLDADVSRGERRLLVAHLGDCRAVMGRREGGSSPGDPLRWRAVRLTEDHRPGEVAEAQRLIAAGARVRRAGPRTEGPGPANLGPPRIWHRASGSAPGLALSRGVGDALGQGCGLMPHATVSEVTLDASDAVLVVASDGVFDALSDAEVLHCCRIFWPTKSAAEAAAAVTAAAGRTWTARGPYRDDATCVVLFF